MIDPQGAQSVAGAAPIVFDAPSGWCFGWFHAARGRRRRAGVVLCRPMGYEALCSYRLYTRLASVLANAGFDVLRFDYHGTGDSAGDDADDARVQAWIDSIKAANLELRRLADTDKMGLFGLRLGGTLALEAALRMGGVDDLVLWAPCASGRAFAREMRAASASRGAGAPAGNAGDFEAFGCLYTAQTVQALNALDFGAAAGPPATRALVIARDDIPADTGLPAKLRSLGVDVMEAPWPGYADLMVAEPHEAKVNPATLDAIAQWLSIANPRSVEAAAAPAGSPVWPENCSVAGVRESVHRFGVDGSLVGVLAQPAGRLPDTAVLMLNVGGNYRIGPNRIYVRAARALAAAGYCALRFDLPGVGDSQMDADFSGANMYTRESTLHVRQALDFLAAGGCKRFYLMGICSGAYVAFQTALSDERVTGQVLLNTRLLEWDCARNGNWQNSMQRYLKSTDHYRRALLQMRVYRRLLQGEIDVAGIARRFWDLFAAYAARAAAMLVGRSGDHDGILDKFKRLSARGCDTLVVMSAQDDGLDYVEFNLGRRARRMKGQPNFRMVMVEDSDHTFSTQGSQRVVIDTIRRHLDERQRPDAAWSPLPRSVPAT
jgi:pimeloyl-ACP methyl ester carboxylesterase